ncbi:MAG TPA: DUF2961 domain-containing protein, partial [Polyangiales bacterium]|nr:DUF2961 domain-containing protein [Polyangiales bacterium]
MMLRSRCGGLLMSLALAAHGCSAERSEPSQKAQRHGEAPASEPASSTPTAAGVESSSPVDSPTTGPAPEQGQHGNAPGKMARPESAPMKRDAAQPPMAAKDDKPPTRAAPNVSGPLSLGTLAGRGMPRAQPGLRFYGTDLGISYEHAGKLWMLFGDTWPNDERICERPAPVNDDTLATLPLEYSGGVPSLVFQTLPEATNDLSYIELVRDGESLPMGYGKAPMTAFSDGEHAFGLFQRLEPHDCDAAYAQGQAACPVDDGFQCSKLLGVCEPAILPMPAVCDAVRGEGCLPTQECKPRTLCVDPNSSQYGDGYFPGQERAAARTVDFAISRANTPEKFDSVLAFPTNKFTVPAARTVAKWSGTLEGNDWKPGRDTVLIWGRPGLAAEHEREAYLYLMAVKLPLPIGESGKLDFHPQYFSGIDPKTGEPSWSPLQSKAKPIALDGVPNGDPHEPVQVLTSMSVSWLGAPINKWMMLYGGDLADYLLLDAPASRGARTPGAIWLRFADQPWGPFSRPAPHLAPGTPLRSHDAYGPGGYMFHPACVSTSDDACAPTDPHRPLDTALEGCPIALEDPGRLYSPNIIDSYTRPNDAGGLDVFWNVSTWNPYSVRLFKTSVSPPSAAPRANDELADARALARLSSWQSLPVLGPIQHYTQHSSYDRGTEDHTFPLTNHGNRDFNNFVCASKDASIGAEQMAPYKYDLAECREDYVRGVVLSRFEGAGRMVRMWFGMQSLVFAPADTELLRIYVDDDPKPRIEARLQEVLDGRAGEIFAPPFGAGSPTRMAWYYPVSFEKKLIVAVDRLGELDNIFFQCDYVSDAESRAASSRERLPERDAAFTQLGAVFHPAGTQQLLHGPLALTLAEGESQTVRLRGPATLNELQVQVREEAVASLAQIGVQVRWDGASAPAIDVSLADLLGGSVPPESSSLALSSMLEYSDRLITLKLPMPFRERAELRFENRGPREASFGVQLRGARVVPAERFGYLHVQRTELLGPTRELQRTAVSARGRGRLVGVCNEVQGHPDANAGIMYHPLNLLEGDVRVRADERLVLNGTGSEEYADDVFYFVDAPHANAFVQAWGTSQVGHASFCRWHVLGTELDF